MPMTITTIAGDMLVARIQFCACGQQGAHDADMPGACCPHQWRHVPRNPAIILCVWIYTGGHELLYFSEVSRFSSIEQCCLIPA